MLDRGDSERSDPRAPWNQPDAIMCPKHPDIEMNEVEDEDENGKHCFTFCEVCLALEENQDGNLHCEVCHGKDLEYDHGPGFYCLRCEMHQGVFVNEL